MEPLFLSMLQNTQKLRFPTKYVTKKVPVTTTSQWIARVFLQEDNTGLSTFYALSEELTVPEPSTLALAAFGLIGLLGYAWRRRRMA